MERERETEVVTFVSGLLLGALIGAGVAFLSAPQSGRRTRRKIRKAARQFSDGAADRWDELAEEMKGKVDETIRVAKRSLG